MNDHNHHNTNNGFVSGFIVGVVVGAAVVFLFFTKKGKKLLKLLSEEGLEGVSELEELIAEELIEEKPKSVKQKPTKAQNLPIESKDGVDDIPPLTSQQKEYIPHALGRIQTPARRFFKGIPKRSSR